MARCLIATISICAWLAISNHCVVTALVTKPHLPGCPLHSKPAKSESQGAGTECCKILRAVSNTLAKDPAPAIVELIFAELVVLSPPKICFSSATLDTGPPGKTSFIELNRSLRAHAPPVSV
jgi:hypothetical protein